MASDFNEPLFGCFSDICSCLLVTCVPCGCNVLQSITVTKVSDESCIIPYCLPILLGCIGSAINRGEIRESLNVSGNFCSDFAISCFCLCLTVCQEYREVTRHFKAKAKT